MFVISMCMAANDVKFAMLTTGSANPSDHPEPNITHHRRFTYWVRLTQGHLFEAIDALTSWRSSEAEVRSLLATLPAGAKGQLKIVCGLEQRLGLKVLERVRHGTFHYPHPELRRSPDSTLWLREAIEREASLESEIDLTESGVVYRFADQLALSIAIANHDDDDDRLREQADLVRDAGFAFVGLAAAIYRAYCERRNLGFEIVD